MNRLEYLFVLRMIVCSHCLHQNLDEAAYCEACGVRLADPSGCPNCGSLVQDHARFCGQCGFNLKLSLYQRIEPADAFGTNSDVLLPEPFPPEPALDLSQVATASGSSSNNEALSLQSVSPEIVTDDDFISDDFTSNVPEGDGDYSYTELQTHSASLLHVQSNSVIELLDYKTITHIGKPNDRIPPDINVSAFASAEVVSRVHAAIHREGEMFFVEDVGSANGTYLNNLLLTSGTRYRLRVGDRICLGKGDLVTFVFKMN